MSGQYKRSGRSASSDSGISLQGTHLPSDGGGRKRQNVRYHIGSEAADERTIGERDNMGWKNKRGEKEEEQT